jgi:hypothetical protein
MTRLKAIGFVLVGMLAVWLLLPPEVQAQLRPGRFSILNIVTRVLVGSGTNLVPSYSFAARPTLGIYSPAADQMAIDAGGGVPVLFGVNLLRLASGATLGFSSNTSANLGTTDTAITRAAAGELTYTTVAFAALGTPANGTLALCSDCQPTTRATCPGTLASCICATGGTGSLAVRTNSVWYCPF